jgi:glycosyltransferase involved in cell wall biosynthesis
MLQNDIPIDKPNVNNSKVNSDIILVVAMLNSPHFHTWLRGMQLEFPEKRLILFPSDRPRLTRSSLNNLKSDHKKTKVVKFTYGWRFNYLWSVILDKTVKLPWRSYFLGRIIIKYKPATLHFHEMQHGAYIYNYLVGYRKISSRTKTIISTWGSDLTLYSWVDSHRAQIQTSLHWAKVLTAEKTEEITDASRLGFKGEFKAPVYIHLGRKPRLQTDFSIPSKRNRIFLKGYQGTPGRALNGLAAILKVRDLLENFEILVFSASEAVEVQLDLMRNKNGINIKTVSGNHKEMQSLFHTARVSVGLSISDGLPAAFIESLYAGCFPIQSENSAIRKFICNGKNGFLVDAWDLDATEKALRISLTDDTLVDSAVEFNRIVLNKEYDLDVGLRKLRSLYD